MELLRQKRFVVASALWLTETARCRGNDDESMVADRACLRGAGRRGRADL